MRPIGFFGALALIALVNAAVLGGVAWNRAGEPEATLRLTERELPVRTSFRRLREDSGMALQLTLLAPDNSPAWLDADKLRTLGFRPDRYLPPHDNGDACYKVAPPRRAWIVLEFEGPAWEAALVAREQELLDLQGKIVEGEATKQQLEDGQGALEHLRVGASRLVAVDAGLYPVALRERYADSSRYLIVNAELRMRVTRPCDRREDAGGQRVHGVIANILTRRIHVPTQHRAALDAALGEERGIKPSRGEAGHPRYAVLLNWGARYEPWIAEIKALQK